MYNRYIPGSGGYTRITVAEPGDRPPRPQTAPPPSPGPPPQSPPPQNPPSQSPPSGQGRTAPRQPPVHSQNWGGGSPIPGGQGLLDSLAAPLRLLTGEDKNGGINGVLKSLHLEELDSGDVLLLLIMLFLFMEGDNLELVITLALMLLLSLGDDKKEGGPPPPEGPPSSE